MTHIELRNLANYAKKFSGLTPEREALLIRIGPTIIPRLPKITDTFYAILATIPEPARYLEDRIDSLKQTHLRWLGSLFSGPFDLDFAAAIHRAGQIHVRVDLPIEFMAGGMTLIGDLLIAEIERCYTDDAEIRSEAHAAVNAVLGFSLIVMQEALQDSKLNQELEKFIKITGISRPLFNNLAAAYR
jgi:hypothetical protein